MNSLIYITIILILSGLFRDPRAEINELSSMIKKNLDSLTSDVGSLQNQSNRHARVSNIINII